jgi:hypothetical protein
MLYMELITVDGESYKEHMNTLREQSADLLMLNLAVHVLITQVQRNK